MCKWKIIFPLIQVENAKKPFVQCALSVSIIYIAGGLPLETSALTVNMTVSWIGIVCVM